MTLFFCLMMWQQHYFLDGTSFVLENGAVVKTVEPVTEDREQYTWTEEGVYVSLLKTKVAAVSYFSMAVPGKRPGPKANPRVLRRISGKVAYRNEGTLYLKCRHVNERGRSAEGGAIPNRVMSLKQVGASGEDFHNLAAAFKTLETGYRVSFKFYDLKGVLVYQSFLDTNNPPGIGKKRKKKRKKKRNIKGYVFEFQMPAAINLETLGLVEVINESI